MNDNPYNSPLREASTEKPNGALSSESTTKIRSAARIAKLVSLVCIAGVLFTCYATWQIIGELDRKHGYITALHYTAWIRFLLAPALLVFAIFAWRNATTMIAVCSAPFKSEEDTWNQHAVSTKRFWIALLVVTMVPIMEILARFYLVWFGTPSF